METKTPQVEIENLNTGSAGAPLQTKKSPLKIAPPSFSISSAILSLWQLVVYSALIIFALESFFYFACVGDSEHIQPDKKVGFKPFAGKRITQRKEGFGCFRLNSFGMQDDEIALAKAPNTYRVAVFGDSYVEALHVPRSKNFVNVLEKQLSERMPGKNIEVLNFGVSNYSIGQDYLRYQTLARQFKPDLVVQTFRVEEISKLLPQATTCLLFVRPVFFSDYQGNIKYDDTCVRGYYESREGKRMLSTQWLRQNSRIWGVVGEMMQSWMAFEPELKKGWKEGLNSLANIGKSNEQGLSKNKADQSKPAGFSLPTDETRKNYANCYWYMMDGQLSAFQKACTADGAKFMFLRTPMVRPGAHDLTDNNTESKLLAQTAAKLGVPLLDLDHSYRQEFSTHDDGTRFSGGGHFTVPTHQWVGLKTAEFISSSELLPKP